MNDRDHPFLRPLYRRVLLTAFCAGWAAWELYNGEEMWFYISIGMTAYAAYVFLFTYNQKGPPKPGTPDPDAAAKE